MSKAEIVAARRGQSINWVTTGFMAFFHAGAIAALFMFTWQALAVSIFLLWLAGSPGIGMGYHRLLTHRGYKTPKWVEYFLTICGALTLEGGPIFWVAVHRVHHARSDREGDPHSPRDGVWWSHMGWILRGESLHHNTEFLSHYAPDLAKDRFHVWLTRLHWVPIVVLAALLLAIGGWPMMMWGVFVRTVVGLHVTWMVNSVTHLWGTRRFETRDDSRNNWLIGLLAFGEGWHNNHHAHPTSARHGLAWYEIDINWWGIQTLRLLGLAKEIRVVQLSEPVPEAEPEVAVPVLQSAA